MHIDHEDRELILIALRRFVQECASQLSGTGIYSAIHYSAWHCTDFCARKAGKIIERIEQYESKGE